MKAPDKAQQTASNPKNSVWVAASAGSGKTSVLSDRVLRLMLSGVPPEKILCLTFTKTAAAEMSNRIAGELSAWATIPTDRLTEHLTLLNNEIPDDKTIKRARRLFAMLLETAGGVKIMTIHAFAQSLLKRFPCEADVPPHFDILDDLQSEELARKARTEIFADSQYRQDLNFITQETTPDTFTSLLNDIMQSLPNLKRTADSFDNDSLKRAYEKILCLPENASERSLKESFCTLSDEKEKDLQTALTVLNSSSSKTDLKNAAVLAAFLSATPVERPDMLETYKNIFIKKTFSSIEEAIRSRLTTKQTDSVDSVLYQEAQRVLALLKDLDSVYMRDCSLALAHIGTAVALRYTQKKQQSSLLDYDDLIRKAATLLQTAPDWVMYKLDGGIDHILVDEAQDTSPEQWLIIKSLADEFFSGQGRANTPRTLFVVGDAKQSIYGFQGADPDEFEHMHAFFRQKITQAQQPFETVPMYTSFRSVPPVIDAVNCLLENPQVSFGVLKKDEDGTHTAFRSTQTGRVEIWPLEKQQKTDTKQEWTKPVEPVRVDTASVRLANKIAKRIADMVQKGEVLTSKNRVIEPKDILVLVRNRRVITEDLIRALKSLNVPVAGIDRLKLTDHIAVTDLILLGDFLLYPENDLALASVLRSPLCNIGEEDLFELCYNRSGDETVFDRLRSYENKENSPLKEACLFLKELLSITDTVKPFELYAHILYTRGKMKSFGERLGEQAFDALDEFLSLALTFEETEVPSLQLFLKHLRQNDIEIKRSPDESVLNAVRITTVHSAKGLQAPIVFLPDTVAKKYHVPSYFWHKDKDGNLLPFWKKGGLLNDLSRNFTQQAKTEEDKESNRLLYVAVTRAADRLYVCGFEQKKEPSEDCWYFKIRNSLETHKSVQKEKDGEDVRLILHNEQETQSVPAARETPEKTVLPDWARKEAQAESIPPKPLAPSRLKEDDIQESPLTPARHLALERGTLVHKLLEFGSRCDRDSFAKRAAGFLKIQAGDYDDDFRADILNQVMNILDNDDYRAIFSENSLAEVGVSGILKDNVFVGKIDRLAVLEKQVLIVDYKTGQKVPSAPEKISRSHLNQMRAYQGLIKQIYPDKTVRCFLLWTTNGVLMEIPSSLLGNP